MFKQVGLKFCAAKTFVWLATAVALTLGSPSLAQQTAPPARSAELGAVDVAASESGSVDVATRLQLAWSSDRPQRCQFRIALTQDSPGMFSQLENHCADGLSANCFTVAPDGRWIDFDSSSPIASGELQVHFAGKSNSKISLQNQITERVQPQSAQQPSRANELATNQLDANSTTLENVIRGGDFTIAGESERGGQKLTLRRIAGDEIAIRFSDESIHRNIGEAYQLTVKANAASKLRGKNATLHYQLYRVSDGQLVDEQNHGVAVDDHGDSVAISIQGKAPKQSGVYEIRCRLSDDSVPIWSRLRFDDPMVTESHAVMVVTEPASDDDLDPNEVDGPRNWSSLGEIRPAQQPGWELKQWLPGGRRGSPTSAKANTTKPGLTQARHDGQPVSLLETKSSYSTRLPRLEPGVPHRLTIRYPAEQIVRIQVDLSPTENFDRDVRSLHVLDTPPLHHEGAWRSQSLLVYPTASDTFVRLTNLDDRQVVSFESIQVDVDRTSDSNERESRTRVANRTTLLNLHDYDWMMQFVGDNEPTQRDGFQPDTIAAHRLVVATRRLKDYLSLRGYNAVVIPGNRGAQTRYRVDQVWPIRMGEPFSDQSLQTILRQMNGSGFRVYVGCDLATRSGSPEPPTSRFENPFRGDRSSTYRILETTQQARYSDWLSQLDQQCVSQKSYAGIVVEGHRLDDNELRADSTVQSEQVLRRYIEQLDNGQLVNRAANHPLPTANLAQQRAWVASQGIEKLRHWCDDQCVHAFRRLASDMRGQLIWIGGPASTPSGKQRLILTKELNVKPLVASDTTPAGSLPRSSDPSAVAVVIQPQSYRPELDLSFGNRQLSIRELTQSICSVNPEYLVISVDSVSMRWDERHREAMQDFAALPLRGWTRMDSADPDATTVQVQQARADNQSIVVISNLAPWQSDVRIHCAATLPWKVANKTKGQTDDVATDIVLRQDGPDLTLSIPPGRFVVLRASNDNQSNPVRSWISQVSGGEASVSEIKKQVTEVVERIGTLAQPKSFVALSNGGFEQASPFEQADKETVAGWMHTQHPVDSVKIDSTEASEGRQSIVLKTESASAVRTWIVSEQFSPPQSGRLAVSLACRGELVPEDQTKQSLQISIEGTRNGEPIRYTQTIQIQRDGQWQPRHVVLEADNVTSQTVDSIRLTIDSLSRGRVWIDDIQLHDWFSMAQERRLLQDQAFMAVQGLQRGSLTPASSLLQNYWARSLLIDDPASRLSGSNSDDLIRDQALANASNNRATKRSWAPARVTTADSKEASGMTRLRRAAKKVIKPPSVAERIKGWLPRPLRF